MKTISLNDFGLLLIRLLAGGMMLLTKATYELAIYLLMVPLRYKVFRWIHIIGYSRNPVSIQIC